MDSRTPKVESKTPMTDALREKLNIGTVLLTDPRLEVFSLCDTLELVLAAAERRVEQEQNFKYNANKRAEAAEARAREAEKFPAFYVARFDLAMKELGFDKPDPNVMGEVWCSIYEMAKTALAAGKEG